MENGREGTRNLKGVFWWEGGKSQIAELFLSFLSIISEKKKSISKRACVAQRCEVLSVPTSFYDISELEEQGQFNSAEPLFHW